MKFVGIDISKLSFDVALSNNGTYQTGKFDNNLKGFKSFSKWRSQFDDTFIFCMEATGVYGNNLAKFLYQDNEKVIVSNPLKTHAFTKMELCRNKTDQTDAISLAKYCEYLSTSTKLNENLYKPKSESAERLQYLVTRLEQLNKNHLQETSRLEICQDQEIKKSIRDFCITPKKFAGQTEPSIFLAKSTKICSIIAIFSILTPIHPKIRMF